MITSTTLWAKLPAALCVLVSCVLMTPGHAEHAQIRVSPPQTDASTVVASRFEPSAVVSIGRAMPLRPSAARIVSVATHRSTPTAPTHTTSVMHRGSEVSSFESSMLALNNDVVVPRGKADDPTVMASDEVEPRSYCHKRGIMHSLRLLNFCPVDKIARVKAWSPDAVVVLGGGILNNGRENCATAQRAHAARDLLERTGLTASIVLSGRGPVRDRRNLDAAERTCVSERLSREALVPELTEQDRAALRRSEVRARETGRGSPTESDLMCATILREVPETRWSVTMGRMVFESRSGTTVENARFTSPLMRDGRFRRALVLTSPVVRKHVLIDNHPERALYDFLRARTHGGGEFDLGALGCPLRGGGPSWMSVEQ